jgi:NADH dehydrogenase
MVDPHLRLPSHPNVYALGDCAWFPVPEENGRPAPPNAQTAVRQAPVVAANVVASLRGAPLTAYHYASEANLVALGQGDGVARVGERRLEGLPAWLFWRGFYLTQLMGFKNRLGVLVEWTSAYLGQRVTARLDTAPTTVPNVVASPEQTTRRRSKAAAALEPAPAASPTVPRATARRGRRPEPDPATDGTTSRRRRASD